MGFRDGAHEKLLVWVLGHVQSRVAAFPQGRGRCLPGREAPMPDAVVGVGLAGRQGEKSGGLTVGRDSRWMTRKLHVLGAQDPLESREHDWGEDLHLSFHSHIFPGGADTLMASVRSCRRSS